jgi:hypothetical protein
MRLHDHCEANVSLLYQTTQAYLMILGLQWDGLKACLCAYDMLRVI